MKKMKDFVTELSFSEGKDTNLFFIEELNELIQN